MGPTSNFQLTVSAADRASMERRLDEAHVDAKKQALETGKYGILVTRHSSERFTVALSDSVPFGLTLERQLWR
jgi:hypothetical protein